MTPIKVDEAEGPALDWLVAVAIGWTDVKLTGFENPDIPDEPFFRPGKLSPDGVERCGSGGTWSPSSDPHQSWWLIDAHGIALTPPGPTAWWQAQKNGCLTHGPNSLVAALRCIVMNKFGETAEVPDLLAPRLHQQRSASRPRSGEA